MLKYVWVMVSTYGVSRVAPPTPVLESSVMACVLQPSNSCRLVKILTFGARLGLALTFILVMERAASPDERIVDELEHSLTRCVGSYLGDAHSVKAIEVRSEVCALEDDAGNRVVVRIFKTNSAPDRLLSSDLRSLKSVYPTYDFKIDENESAGGLHRIKFSERDKNQFDKLLGLFDYYYVNNGENIIIRCVVDGDCTLYEYLCKKPLISYTAHYTSVAVFSRPLIEKYDTIWRALNYLSKYFSCSHIACDLDGAVC